LLTFLVDSREQTPWKFSAPIRSEFAEGGSEVIGLKQGDYSVSLDGEPLSIAIERKSHLDFLACCGRERDRFERELERLTNLEYRALVIEASVDTILAGHERSQITPRGAMASLCCWSIKYQIPVWTVQGWRRAGGITQRLLEEFAIHYYRAIRGGADGDESILSADRGRGAAEIPSDSVRVDASGET
jgi:ERCC4-type nuclease